MKVLRWFLPTLLLLPALLIADAPPIVSAPPPGQSDQTLVIYSKGERSLAIVTDTRLMDLKAGDNAVRFADIPDTIDPGSVSFHSLTAPDTTRLVEQRLENAAKGPDDLLLRYVGKPVILNRLQSPLPQDKARSVESLQGILLGFDHDQIVLQTENKQLPVQVVPRNGDISEIKLFDLPEGISSRPMMLWKILTDKTQQHKVQVTYDANGIAWSPRYRITLNKEMTQADITGWATIGNESSQSFTEAKVKLIGGDADHRGNATVFLLPRPVTLQAGATTEVELFAQRHHLAVTQTLFFDGPLGVMKKIENDSYLSIGMGSVRRQIEIKNAPPNGVTLALLGGPARIYVKTENAEEFLCATTLGNTANNAPLVFEADALPDLSGNWVSTVTKEPATGNIGQEVKITLRNSSAAEVKVNVRDSLNLPGHWEISKSSDPFNKVNDSTISIEVSVPASGEKVVSYSVRYTQ